MSSWHLHSRAITSDRSCHLSRPPCPTCRQDRRFYRSVSPAAYILGVYRGSGVSPRHRCTRPQTIFIVLVILIASAQLIIIIIIIIIIISGSSSRGSATTKDTRRPEDTSSVVPSGEGVTDCLCDSPVTATRCCDIHHRGIGTAML